MGPALPFQAESLAALQARYTQALEPVYSTRQVLAGKTERPGSQRQHVFDTVEGYRLIISCERLGSSDAVLHVSCSEPPSREPLGRQARLARSLAQFHQISRSASVPRHMECSPRMLHFIFDAPPARAVATVWTV